MTRFSRTVGRIFRAQKLSAIEERCRRSQDKVDCCCIRRSISHVTVSWGAGNWVFRHVFDVGGTLSPLNSTIRIPQQVFSGRSKLEAAGIHLFSDVCQIGRRRSYIARRSSLGRFLAFPSWACSEVFVYSFVHTNYTPASSIFHSVHFTQVATVQVSP